MVTSGDTGHSDKWVGEKHGVVSGGRLEKTVKLLESVSCRPRRKRELETHPV